MIETQGESKFVEFFEFKQTVTKQTKETILFNLPKKVVFSFDESEFYFKDDRKTIQFSLKNQEISHCFDHDFDEILPNPTAKDVIFIENDELFYYESELKSLSKGVEKANWSKKGKQIVVSTKEGLKMMKKSGEVVKEIPKPSEFGKTKAILWVDNTTIIVYYDGWENGDASLIVFDLKKDVYIRMEDPVCRFGNERENNYKLSLLESDDLFSQIIIIANEASSDIGLIGCIDSEWCTLVLDEGKGIVMPFVNDEDTWPIDCFVSYEYKEKLKGATVDAPEIGPFPVFNVKSNLGDIFSFFCIKRGEFSTKFSVGKPVEANIDAVLKAVNGSDSLDIVVPQSNPIEASDKFNMKTAASPKSFDSKFGQSFEANPFISNSTFGPNTAFGCLSNSINTKSPMSSHPATSNDNRSAFDTQNISTMSINMKNVKTDMGIFGKESSKNQMEPTVRNEVELPTAEHGKNKILFGNTEKKASITANSNNLPENTILSKTKKDLGGKPGIFAGPEDNAEKSGIYLREFSNIYTMMEADMLGLKKYISETTAELAEYRNPKNVVSISHAALTKSRIEYQIAMLLELKADSAKQKEDYKGLLEAIALNEAKRKEIETRYAILSKSDKTSKHQIKRTLSPEAELLSQTLKYKKNNVENDLLFIKSRVHSLKTNKLKKTGSTLLSIYTTAKQIRRTILELNKEMDESEIQLQKILAHSGIQIKNKSQKKIAKRGPYGLFGEDAYVDETVLHAPATPNSTRNIAGLKNYLLSRPLVVRKPTIQKRPNFGKVLFKNESKKQNNSPEKNEFYGDDSWILGDSIIRSLDASLIEKVSKPAFIKEENSLIETSESMNEEREREASFFSKIELPKDSNMSGLNESSQSIFGQITEAYSKTSKLETSGKHTHPKSPLLTGNQPTVRTNFSFATAGFNIPKNPKEESKFSDKKDESKSAFCENSVRCSESVYKQDKKTEISPSLNRFSANSARIVTLNREKDIQADSALVRSGFSFAAFSSTESFSKLAANNIEGGIPSEKENTKISSKDSSAPEFVAFESKTPNGEVSLDKACEGENNLKSSQTTEESDEVLTGNETEEWDESEKYEDSTNELEEYTEVDNVGDESLSIKVRHAFDASVCSADSIGEKNPGDAKSVDSEKSGNCIETKSVILDAQDEMHRKSTAADAISESNCCVEEKEQDIVSASPETPTLLETGSQPRNSGESEVQMVATLEGDERQMEEADATPLLDSAKEYVTDEIDMNDENAEESKELNEMIEEKESTGFGAFGFNTKPLNTVNPMFATTAMPSGESNQSKSVFTPANVTFKSSAFGNTGSSGIFLNQNNTPASFGSFSSVPSTSSPSIDSTQRLAFGKTGFGAKAPTSSAFAKPSFNGSSAFASHAAEPNTFGGATSSGMNTKSAFSSFGSANTNVAYSNSSFHSPSNENVPSFRTTGFSSNTSAPAFGTTGFASSSSAFGSHGFQGNTGQPTPFQKSSAFSAFAVSDSPAGFGSSRNAPTTNFGSAANSNNSIFGKGPSQNGSFSQSGNTQTFGASKFSGEKFSGHR